MISYRKAVHTLTDGGDDTRSFMAEDAGRRVRARANLLEIRTANPARGHTQKHFAGPNARHWHRFHPHVVHAAVNSRLHCLRNTVGRV
jgi:hypothetical protein